MPLKFSLHASVHAVIHASIPTRRLLPMVIILPAFLAAASLPLARAVAESDSVHAAEGAADADFAAWKGALRQEALGRGISQATLDKALTLAAPIPRIIELDHKQPEFTQTFWRYLDARVNETRIARGRAMLKDHAALLDKVWRKYHVPPRFLVAFWGMESNYGDHFGGYPVVDALATLAYDPRRSRFFREQLFDALKIIDRGDISVEQMRGSWAGAMGHLQFIPSTFVQYAVDADGDGKRDIWNSLPDTFATAANYLSSIGWHGDETWGREVRLPEGFDYELASSSVSKPLAEWAKLGVRQVNGKPLPHAGLKATLVLPSGYQGPAFLAYANYDRILNWNRSALYAIAVGHLADRLIGRGPLQGPRPANEQPLSRATVIEMQQRLAAHGFDVGATDGVIGPTTRTAIRDFQKAKGMTPDGFPTTELLEKLRGG
jgi:membrane-bound lytic murein transglycosylase B